MDYSNLQFSSDLDAFRSDGTVYTGSFTFSGNLGAGASQVRSTSTITIPDLDFYKVLYDNSQHSSGKYRDINLENATAVYETTTPTYQTAILTVERDGNDLVVTGELFNPQSYTIAVQSTTINVRIVTYDNTV